jgi:hypothetical protein
MPYDMFGESDFSRDRSVAAEVVGVSAKIVNRRVVAAEAGRGGRKGKAERTRRKAKAMQIAYRRSDPSARSRTNLLRRHCEERAFSRDRSVAGRSNPVLCGMAMDRFPRIKSGVSMNRYRKSLRLAQSGFS